jgi:hypothetical protein
VCEQFDKLQTVTDLMPLISALILVAIWALFVFLVGKLSRAKNKGQYVRTAGLLLFTEGVFAIGYLICAVVALEIRNLGAAWSVISK